MWPEPENGTGTLGSEKSIRSPPKELTGPSVPPYFFAHTASTGSNYKARILRLSRWPDRAPAGRWVGRFCLRSVASSPPPGTSPMCIGALKQLHGEDRVKHLAEVLTAASSTRPIKTKHRTSVSEEAYCVSSCVHKLIIVHVEKHV